MSKLTKRQAILYKAIRDCMNEDRWYGMMTPSRDGFVPGYRLAQQINYGLDVPQSEMNYQHVYSVGTQLIKKGVIERKVYKGMAWYRAYTPIEIAKAKVEKNG